jgi:hypothetical protein
MIFRRKRDRDHGVVRHGPRCSFCGKERGESGVKLVTGAGAYICSECVSLAHEMIQGHNPPAPA